MRKLVRPRRTALTRRKLEANGHNLSKYRTLVVVAGGLLATAIYAASVITALASSPRSPGLQEALVSQIGLVDRGQAVGVASRLGYASGWVAYRSGAVVAYGGAPYLGSGLARSAPVVGIAASPSGKGYWLVTASGQVIGFGDARKYSGPSPRTTVRGIAASAHGHGYLLLDRTGKVYPYGDAVSYGGASGCPGPFRAIATTPDRKGYWLISATGRVYNFGDAPNYGPRAPQLTGGQSFLAFGATPNGRGYQEVTMSGRILSSGDTPGFSTTDPSTTITTVKVTTSMALSSSSTTAKHTPAPATSSLAVDAGRAMTVASATTSAPTTPTVASPRPVGNDPGPWHLVFDSEFNGSSLDHSQWSTGAAGGTGLTSGYNTLEQECYDPAQVRVTGGALDLTAIAKKESCYDWNLRSVVTEPYASGAVSTDRIFSFTYGYMEARIWLPSGPDGIADWPAFAATGQNWPTDGEIDVLEGLHGQACAHFNGPSGAGLPGFCSTVTFTGGWYTFAADWEPGSVTYYYDGTEVWSDTSGVTSEPMYLILCLAASTHWAPITVPATMQVDYVRVWQHRAVTTCSPRVRETGIYASTSRPVRARGPGRRGGAAPP